MTTFRLLVGGPQPIALEGRTVGLRAETVGLLDLRAMVFHPATSVSVQRDVLVELARQARRHRGRGSFGLAGVLLPGLRRPATEPTPDCSGVANLHAILLAGLLEQLDAPGVASEEAAERLLWTTVRSPAEPASPARARARLVVVAGAAG